MSKCLRHAMPASVPSTSRRHTAPDADALAAAQAVLLAGLQMEQPEYLRDRYARLAAILEMLEDDSWSLSMPDRQRILNALAGLVIASGEAGTQHLILIELASRELRHDLDAYQGFRRLRAAAVLRHSPHDADRACWLAERRDALQLRMRELRDRDHHKGDGTWRRWRSLWNW